eukprot:COSAG04_NODE_10279_length_790_cov_1.331404_1_plen_83_part_10
MATAATPEADEDATPWNVLDLQHPTPTPRVIAAMDLEGEDAEQARKGRKHEGPPEAPPPAKRPAAAAAAPRPRRWTASRGAAS